MKCKQKSVIFFILASKELKCYIHETQHVKCLMKNNKLMTFVNKSLDILEIN